MIDCTAYRRALLANPREANPELAAHRASCRVCALYTERLLGFESRLERALQVSAPDHAQPTRASRGWLAMAASITVAFVIAGGLWVSAPHSSLAADVVAHMAGEPQAWARTDVAVPSADLAVALADARMRLGAGAGTVSYARSCAFRGHHVPHLVVQTAVGPITVMVLVHESVSKVVPFDEEGYRGVILPVAGHGSLAVLAKGQAVGRSELEAIAARVESAIVWVG
ncbi:MAG TPA: DUF3379 family protein [Steroidobacteraceae bacterium]|nr:DUF3379 family protein [Steroidobacteraceae bacterium]